jgi:hypothetical protein
VYGRAQIYDWMVKEAVKKLDFGDDQNEYKNKAQNKISKIPPNRHGVKSEDKISENIEDEDFDS